MMAHISMMFPLMPLFLRKEYIRLPDGSWMQLQTSSEAQVTSVDEQVPAPGPPAPSTPGPVLTMEIPGLDNISKKLEVTLAGQQRAEMAISSLQEQLAEEKKRQRRH